VRAWLRAAAATAAGAGLVWLALRLHADPAHGRSASFALVSGAAFGFVLQRSRFCFASAFRDLFLLRDRRVALGVLAAIATGSVGYLVVFGAWVPDPTAGYLPPTAHIAPAGWHLLLGGGAFGLGMVLAGGCISGNLYRLGEGSVTALVALVSAGAGFWGGFAAWPLLYTTEIATAPVIWLPAHLGYAGALAVQLGAMAMIAALLIHFLPAPAARAGERPTLGAALRRVFVQGWPAWMGGVAVGVIGTFTFLRTRPLGVTSEMGRYSRRAGEALGLVPVRLDGLDTLAGCRAIATEAVLSENGLFVAALVAGSFCAAMLAGEFRVRLGRPRGYFLAVPGGLLLGFGAMISLGCTVGTLLSGTMAFSMSGWVFAVGLLGGAWVGAAVLRRLA
jgi:uncharacterized membrane protein YedE/YeeE